MGEARLGIPVAVIANKYIKGFVATLFVDQPTRGLRSEQTEDCLYNRKDTLEKTG
jgi:hypothetical protein